MEFIPKAISEYSELHSDPESDILKELNRQTHLKAGMPRMLSGHLQGRVLSFLSHLNRPNRILEIGTYTGYSALCLAEGLSENGILYSIDSNPETMALARNFIARTPMASKIKLINGDARVEIPKLQEVWDMIFIDADKSNYSLYFDLTVDSLRKGGLIIADNVLWSGKVLDDKKDRDTEAIHAFNEKIRSAKGISKVLLPVRDGLMLIRKD